MTVLVAIIFILLNLIIIDVLVRLLIQRTPESPYFKAAGLYAFFTLSFMRQGAVIFNKSLAFGRFFLSVITATILFGILCATLSQNLSELNSAVLFLSLLPLLGMPFFHVVFGLLGHRSFAVLASIKHFRLQSMVAAVMGANVVFASIGSSYPLVLAAHSLFAFLALVNVFFLASSKRASMSFYSVYREDSDAGSIGFFYYLCTLLELLFYCIILQFYVLGPLWRFMAPEMNDLVTTLFLVPVIYLVAFVIAKLFMVSRKAINVDFYEQRLLPLSFLFFGMALVAEQYL